MTHLNKQEKPIVICGAGFCGISAAYHLSVKQGFREVILIDERAPLSFTSSKSTECYRNWWPGPGDTMVAFSNRSIDLLEELAGASQNYFHLNRRGYAFFTTRTQQVDDWLQKASLISALGAGPLRIHRGEAGEQPYQRHEAEGYQTALTGADLVLDQALIRKTFPFINPDVVAMLHIRRCGWMDAQQFGQLLLNKAREQGTQLVQARLVDVELKDGEVQAVHIKTPEGNLQRIETHCFVNAAGPFINQVAGMMGLKLPVFNELHGKVAFKDHLGIIPRAAPLVLWQDPIQLPWTAEENEALTADEEMRWLLDEFPAGVHFKPEGSADSDMVLALWTYELHEQEVSLSPQFDDAYAEVVMRGLCRMVPNLSLYLKNMQRPVVDGGYYCKTRENRPLIGPLPVKGAYIFGAVSGFGLMTAMAGGELLAQHVVGAALPDYAPAFLLERYDSPEYQALLKNWDATSGQL